MSNVHQDVAQWMLDEILKHGELLQRDAVQEIENIFGSAFVYANENGRPAIDKEVLKEFNKLKPDTVAWDKGRRCWRHEA